ncbi:MAG: hypothetical protein ACFCVG_00180 [Kineosporiaceae bacterium]
MGCCVFLGLAVTVDGDGVRITVGTPDGADGLLDEVIGTSGRAG